MLQAALQLGAEQLAALVPDCYAEFRPIVAEGISFFIEHLSPQRMAQVLDAQLKLPPDAPVETRLVQFIHACPALHKLGQVVARRHELDRGLRMKLQGLESMAPHTPIDQVRPIVVRELGDAIREFDIALSESALAEASVAVVLPLTWRDGLHRRDGVVKVLKPGIIELLDEDLNILGQLADHLDELRAQGKLPPVAYRETFDDVRQLLTHEVQCRREQANLRTAAGQYASRGDVQIPRLLPFCTDHITAMERVWGVKVTEMRSAPQPVQRRLSRLLVGAIIGDALFSRDRDVIFHADPHAGNLFAADDGRLAILDWSLTGRLSLREREQFAQLLVGAMAREPARMLRAIDELSNGTAGRLDMGSAIDRALAELGPLGVPSPMWLMRLLDSLAMGGLRFSPGLMMFRKAFFTLEGVFSDVCSACAMDKALLAEIVRRLAGDWPMRAVRPIGSHEYASHVSTADLMHIAAAAAEMAMGWWTNLWTAWGRAMMPCPCTGGANCSGKLELQLRT